MTSPQRPAALITGGAKRIGLASARTAAANGYDIALHCNQSLTEAEAVAQDLAEQYAVNCQVFQANLADRQQVEQLAKQAIARFPNLSLLINSASVFTPSNMLEESDEFIDNSLQINLLAPWQLCRLCAKHWNGRVERGEALIINYTDQRVTRAAQGHFAYNISKRALKALTETAAVQLAPNTRVNAIAPGLILPPPEMTDPADIEQFMHDRAQPVPLKRSGSIDEIGDAVDTFINNRYLTGQTLFIDGGEHLL